MFCIEENYAYIEDGSTLAINRTQNGYGLIMISANGEAKTVVDFIYDNMYFIWRKKEDFWQDYVNVVKNGKYGAFSLNYDEISEQVECKEVIPCMFDELHLADESPYWIFMKKQQDCYYYNCETEELSSAYDSIVTLHPKVLGLWKDYEQTIIDLSGNKELYKPEYGWEYKYVCEYRDGAVFKVMENSIMYGEPWWASRLVLYSEKLHKTFVTPVYGEIMVSVAETGSGVFFMKGFEVLSDGGWTTYEIEDAFWSDEDIEAFLPREEQEQ